MKAERGFTLVEILVVVVILGILGAIVIPQFKPAATEAKTSRLCSDLQVMRVQIGLYKIQHNDSLPGTAVGVGFEDAMTQKTDKSGALDASGAYGPYIPRIPTNPFNDLGTVEIDGVLGGGTHGWHYSTTTGRFNADTDDHVSL
ncbi:MAG: prepilin-type N-terminal cleavage/methylation domain-containing protein [Sedimentisphaerales bacterium]|nr:prepilin-type N-terminal cleavage/methylation domain-containing protein [Sedimentisphaerales bacterium]